MSTFLPPNASVDDLARIMAAAMEAINTKKREDEEKAENERKKEAERVALEAAEQKERERKAAEEAVAAPKKNQLVAAKARPREESVRAGKAKATAGSSKRARSPSDSDVQCLSAPPEDGQGNVRGPPVKYVATARLLLPTNQIVVYRATSPCTRCAQRGQLCLINPGKRACNSCARSRQKCDLDGNEADVKAGRKVRAAKKPRLEESDAGSDANPSPHLWRDLLTIDREAKQASDREHAELLRELIVVLREVAASTTLAARSSQTIAMAMARYLGVAEAEGDEDEQKNTTGGRGTPEAGHSAERARSRSNVSSSRPNSPFTVQLHIPLTNEEYAAMTSEADGTKGAEPSVAGDAMAEEGAAVEGSAGRVDGDVPMDA
jgi:hypothetical protein